MHSSFINKQRGQIFIVVAMTLIVLIGAVGLAIDSGMGYLLRAKLNAAVDSAAVAGALATSRGNTEAERKHYGTVAAKKFFNANYPSGYLGSTATANDPDISFDDMGRITVDMNANASMPVSFMGAMGFKLMNVESLARVIRKDLDLAFVVDTSASMENEAGEVKNQLATFLDKLHPEIDRVALVHFSTGAEVDVKIDHQHRKFDRPTMLKKIAKYKFDGRTNSSEGFWQGWSELNSIPKANRSSLRVIVFFSDGSPNTFSSRFNFKDQKCRDKVGAIGTPDVQDNSSEESRRKRAIGLYDNTQQDSHDGEAPKGCFRTVDNYDENDPGVTPLLQQQGMPQSYNAYGGAPAFPIVGSGPRAVTAFTRNRIETWKNVSNASRNLVEAMAEQARKEGIYVLTVGLDGKDNRLHVVSPASGIPNDDGENILRCLANSPDAPKHCQRPDQPRGLYCYAKDPKQLEPCFASLAAEILRIAK